MTCCSIFMLSFLEKGSGPTPAIAACCHLFLGFYDFYLAMSLYSAVFLYISKPKFLKQLQCCASTIFILVGHIICLDVPGFGFLKWRLFSEVSFYSALELWKISMHQLGLAL
jgi:hypothetical protein